METMRVKRIFTKKWSSLSFWLWITTSQKVVTKIIMQLVHWNKKGNIIHVGYFSTSIVGEGNGTPLQYSCLENPTDGGAWWAAVYGVAQSRTRLKRLSSSSSKHCCCCLVTKSCTTLLCDPMDLKNSPWGSSVHGISQARILEWVAISSSRG